MGSLWDRFWQLEIPFLPPNGWSIPILVDPKSLKKNEWIPHESNESFNHSVSLTSCEIFATDLPLDLWLRLRQATSDPRSLLFKLCFLWHHEWQEALSNCQISPRVLRLYPTRSLSYAICTCIPSHSQSECKNTMFASYPSTISFADCSFSIFFFPTTTSLTFNWSCNHLINDRWVFWESDQLAKPLTIGHPSSTKRGALELGDIWYLSRKFPERKGQKSWSHSIGWQRGRSHTWNGEPTSIWPKQPPGPFLSLLRCLANRL